MTDDTRQVEPYQWLAELATKMSRDLPPDDVGALFIITGFKVLETEGGAAYAIAWLQRYAELVEGTIKSRLGTD